jgi:hypothetical protein
VNKIGAAHAMRGGYVFSVANTGDAAVGVTSLNFETESTHFPGSFHLFAYTITPSPRNQNAVRNAIEALSEDDWTLHRVGGDYAFTELSTRFTINGFYSEVPAGSLTAFLIMPAGNYDVLMFRDSDKKTGVPLYTDSTGDIKVLAGHKLRSDNYNRNNVNYVDIGFVREECMPTPPPTPPPSPPPPSSPQTAVGGFGGHSLSSGPVNWGADCDAAPRTLLSSKSFDSDYKAHRVLFGVSAHEEVSISQLDVKVRSNREHALDFKIYRLIVPTASKDSVTVGRRKALEPERGSWRMHQLLTAVQLGGRDMTHFPIDPVTVKADETCFFIVAPVDGSGTTGNKQHDRRLFEAQTKDAPASNEVSPDGHDGTIDILSGFSMFRAGWKVKKVDTLLLVDVHYTKLCEDDARRRALAEVSEAEAKGADDALASALPQDLSGLAAMLPSLMPSSLLICAAAIAALVIVVTLHSVSLFRRQATPKGELRASASHSNRKSRQAPSKFGAVGGRSPSLAGCSEARIDLSAAAALDSRRPSTIKASDVRAIRRSRGETRLSSETAPTPLVINGGALRSRRASRNA